jgi:glycerol uptake facilitator-like aquaporin
VIQNANSFFGLAIGFTVVCGAWSVGAISGGAFNPAVATGPTILNAIVNKGTAKYLWVYWLSELLGASLAAVVFRVTNTREYRRAAAIAKTVPIENEGYTIVNDEPEVV